MNNDQARVILSGYRPNDADAQDRIFAEALMQAKMDPALGEWLETQRDLDAAVINRLRTIKPPADLPNAILAGAKTVPLRGPRWLGPLFALAAALAVGALVFAWSADLCVPTRLPTGKAPTITSTATNVHFIDPPDDNAASFIRANG